MVLSSDVVKRNLRIAYLLSFLSELYFPITVWLFYYLKFFDFQQIALITVVKTVSMVVFEVPTGAFADMFGRKFSVFLSFALYAVAMFWFAQNTVFWIFLVIEVIKGLSTSLYSGSLEAIIYDTLKENGEENRYDKVIANTESLSWLALFIGAFTGGFIFSLYFKLPYIFQGTIYIIAALASLRLYEPKLDSVTYTWKQFLKQNIYGIRELFKTTRVAYTSLILISITAAYFIASEILGISQAREYGMDARGVGFLFGTGYIIAAAASQFYPRLKDKFGSKQLLILTCGILLFSFLGAKFAGIYAGSVLIIMRIASSTTFSNLRSSLVNAEISSNNRATAISALTLLSKAPYMLLAYTIGGVIDSRSPNTFALILGITMVLLLGGLFILHTLKNRTKPALEATH